MYNICITACWKKSEKKFIGRQPEKSFRDVTSQMTLTMKRKPREDPASESYSEFECPNNCGRKYKYRQSMMLHFKFECGKEPQFECEFCQKRFAHKGSLRNHVGLVHKVIC